MPNLMSALFVLAAAASPDDPCQPADKTRIVQTIHHASSVQLEWPEAEAGETSRLQLGTNPEFGKPLLIDRRVPCCKTTLRNPDVGTYYWRVLVEPAEREVCRSSFEVVAHGAE